MHKQQKQQQSSQNKYRANDSKREREREGRMKWRISSALRRWMKITNKQHNEYNQNARMENERFDYWVENPIDRGSKEWKKVDNDSMWVLNEKHRHKTETHKTKNLNVRTSTNFTEGENLIKISQFISIRTVCVYSLF